MKTALIIGMIWGGTCLIFLWILWINLRSHRHHASKNDRPNLTPQVFVEKTENWKSTIQPTSKDDVKIVSTNLSLSPKTGKITSPSGEVELESYRRSKAAKTIKKTPPSPDAGEE
jgi:hypothetical protein